MTFKFTPHTNPPKKGDIFHIVQTFAGKTTIEHATVKTIHMSKFLCMRRFAGRTSQIGFYKDANADGSHSISGGIPYVSNARAWPDSQKEMALAEFYRRGGKDNA